MGKQTEPRARGVIPPPKTDVERNRAWRARHKQKIADYEQFVRDVSWGKISSVQAPDTARELLEKWNTHHAD